MLTRSAGLGYFVPKEVADKSAPVVRNWFVQTFGLSTARAVEFESAADQELSEKSTVGNHGLARLSQKSPERFVEGLGDRTRKAITAILSLKLDENDCFSWAAFMRKLGYPINREQELKGVWTGITKRVRTATGDENAY